ncbi:MAG TPA: FIST C-terminal domain-containing protein, partial [Candidatus Ozemobacteraceae bacterium]|nr:FIST C-terminal domain-containing protein [Candidatus Ozemobacteraceae bacterium]
VSEAFKVTGASGNTIETLDWKPAFDVYRQVVERHDGRSFDHTPFFDVAKAYPFGIAKYGAEMVVRDPLMIKEKSLVCVGRVPQESFVHILHGSPESLIKAAGKARDLAYASLRGAEPSAMIFIDCISRVLFLGTEFDRELQTVCLEGLPMVGALTIGEIANCGHEFLEFYNKTSVVGLLSS